MIAGGALYHFYLKKEEQKTNPDEIDAETKMALIQRALDNHNRMTAPRRNTSILVEEDIDEDEL